MADKTIYGDPISSAAEPFDTTRYPTEDSVVYVTEREIAALKSQLSLSTAEIDNLKNLVSSLKHTVTSQRKVCDELTAHNAVLRDALGVIAYDDTGDHELLRKYAEEHLLHDSPAAEAMLAVVCAAFAWQVVERDEYASLGKRHMARCDLGDALDALRAVQGGGRG